MNRHLVYSQSPASASREINELGGQNFTKGLVEWDLPPLRFRRLGGSSLYATWMRLAFFTGVVATDLDRDDLRQTVGTLGAQLNLRVTILSYLKATMSVAYAVALQDGRRPSYEFFASLKIL